MHVPFLCIRGWFAIAFGGFQRVIHDLLLGLVVEGLTIKCECLFLTV